MAKRMFDEVHQPMSEFLSMGGHAFFVWGSYGVTALVIVVELLALRARRRAAEAHAVRSGDGDLR